MHTLRTFLLLAIIGTNFYTFSMGSDLLSRYGKVRLLKDYSPEIRKEIVYGEKTQRGLLTLAALAELPNKDVTLEDLKNIATNLMIDNALEVEWITGLPQGHCRCIIKSTRG